MEEQGRGNVDRLRRGCRMKGEKGGVCGWIEGEGVAEEEGAEVEGRIG